MVQLQTCDVNQANERMVRIFKIAIDDAIPESIEIILPFQLVVIVEVKKFGDPIANDAIVHYLQNTVCRDFLKDRYKCLYSFGLFCFCIG